MRPSLRVLKFTIGAASVTGWLSLAAEAADCNCRQGAAPARGLPAMARSNAVPVIPVADPTMPIPQNGPLTPGYTLPPSPAPSAEFPQSLPQAQHPLPQHPLPAIGSAPLSPLPEPPAPSGEQVAPPANRFGIAPPPGTLGRTYQRRSTLIDDDKHPRMAAVDVHLPEEADVTARGLKARWTGSVWRLETETPLLPGVPHIYAVKAERLPGNGDKLPEVRWVRLIPGRIVDLEFE